MNYVFMDNFRGFSETIIPLSRANFLVGENSTGKSSFLSLFALFTTAQFWYNPDFSLSEFANIGGFNDIISATSSISNIFTVGFISIEGNAKKKENSMQYKFDLMTFRNEEGMPRLSRYVQYKQGQLLKIFFLPKTTRYKLINSADTFDTEDDFFDFLMNIFIEDLTDRRDFKLLKNFPTHVPLPVVSALIQSLDKTKNKVEINFPMDMPIIRDLTWLAPIRTKPRRIYAGFKTDFTPEGDHTPYVIRKTLGSRDKAQKFIDLIKSFGDSSGLFTGIDAHSFGRDPSAPFEVQIELQGKPLNINNVGYGVSQVLPVVVEMLTSPNRHWFAIQQPEVHLHPRAQASLGELIHFLVQEREHHYVVETHSDYLIDRFRLQVKSSGGPEGCQVIFFERTEAGNIVYPIQINEKGQYTEDQPKSFRDFFIREEMSLLEI